MKKALFAVLALALFTAVGSAQTTTVSLNGVTDSDGTVWNAGTWKVDFVVGPAEPNPTRYSNNGSPVSQSVLHQTGTLNASGVGSIVVYDNTLTTPLGSQWQLQVCPNASSPCTTFTFVASGTTLDITSTVNAGITAPRFQGISGMRGYVDGEVLSPTAGATYYNVISVCQKTYSGSSWACAGASFPGVTSNGSNGLTISGSPSASTDAATVGYVSAHAGGGFTIPILNTGTGAAAANLTALNGALVTGGSVRIVGTPGVVYVINTPVILHSRTLLTAMANVWLKQADNQNVDMLQNYASTQPWISAGVSVAWTSGLTATVTWPAHGQVVGNYVSLEGTVSYLSTGPTYVSGLSACTDGTQNVSVAAATETQASTVVGTITVSGGVPTGAVTITNPSNNISGNINLGSFTTVATCTGTAVWSGGVIATTDGSFSGVFPVASVVDANTITVTLRRIPNVGPSGVIYVKAADTDIRLDSIYLDYNYLNNSGATNSDHTITVMLAGCQGCSVTNYTPINGLNWNLLVAGVRDFNQDFMNSNVDFPKESVKFEGPIFDSQMGHIATSNGDDTSSMQSYFYAGFVRYAPPGYASGGDLIGIRVHDLHSQTHGGCGGIYGDSLINSSAYPAHLIDDIIIENSGCSVKTGATRGPFFLVGPTAVGHVLFRNLTCDTDTTLPCLLVSGINSNRSSPGEVEVDGLFGIVSSPVNVQTLMRVDGPSGILNKISVRNMKLNAFHSGDVGLNLNGSGGALLVEVGSSEIYGAVAGGTLVTSSSTVTKTLHIHDNISTLNGQILTLSGTPPIVTLANNYFSTSQATAALGSVAQSSVAATFNVRGNNVASGWLVSCGGVIHCTINSGGTNVTNTTLRRFIGTVSSTPTFDIFGGCNDAYVDVTDTTVGKLQNSCISNFNSTYGIGPMRSNGTAFFPDLSNWGTVSVSGCSLTGATGSGTIGQFASGTSGACTVVITPGFTTRGTGFKCSANDITTPADTLPQTASSTTTCTISGTTVSGDVIQFEAHPY